MRGSIVPSWRFASAGYARCGGGTVRTPRKEAPKAPGRMHRCVLFVVHSVLRVLVCAFPIQEPLVQCVGCKKALISFEWQRARRGRAVSSGS